MQQAIKTNSFCKTYRLTAGLKTLRVWEVKGGNRQNDGSSRRQTEKVEVGLWEGKFGGGKGKWLFENTKEGQGYKGDAERGYLLKNARSFLASTVSRRVSLPALVVTVSMVTVWLAAGSFLPSSSSLSELLEEELSDATKGAFLATHTLHTHATE